jgi:hypothetical protein
MAITMKLYLPDAEAVAECECGARCHGDSIADAVLAWAKHIVGTECREKL